MSLIKVKAKKWGNSLGLLVPNEVVKKEKLHDNQNLTIVILTKAKTLEKSFGMVKRWKKSGQQIKDEIRRELHNE